MILRVGQEYLDRAVWYEDQGLDEQAKDYYLKAITLWDRAINELPPSVFSATTYYFLAVSCRQLGEHQAVIDYSETLVQNWPDYEYVEDAQYWIEDSYQRLSNSGK